MYSKTTALAIVAIVAAVTLITATAVVNPVFAGNSASVKNALKGHQGDKDYVKCIKKGEETRGLKQYEVRECKEKHLH